MLTSDKNAKPNVVKFPVQTEETEREWRLNDDDDLPVIERNWSLDDNPDESIQTAQSTETENPNNPLNPNVETPLANPQTTELPETLSPSAPPQPNKMHWKVYAVLLGTLVLSVWLSQQSINAYWQQTYHKASPLESLNHFTLWQLGAKIQANVTETFNPPNPNDDDLSESKPYNSPSVIAKQPENSNVSLHVPSNKPDTAVSSQHNDSVVWLHSGDKVLFVGDSIMQGIAPHVQRWLKSDYQIDSINLSKQSTGLAYPKFFDWPTTIEQTLQNDKNIKLLIILLGANDPWDFPNPQGGAYLKFQSPEWNQEYLRRVNRIVQAAKANQARIIWLGTPYMRRNDLDKGVRYLNQLIGEELVTQSPTVIWLPTDMLLSDTKGYQDSMTIDGQVVRIRTKDGVHLNSAGQIFMSNYLNSYIKSQ